tara:strand:+ start:337 stop:906 length:570 start_codon:yes stop_codon:yes gene_type:complete
MDELNSSQNNKPVTTGQWMLTTFLAGLPIAGFILKLIWAFGKGHHPSKTSWAKAKLMWTAILFPGIIIIGILAAIAVPTYFKLTENSYAKEAEIQIKNMAKSAGQYRLYQGELPPDCWETMKEIGLIEIKTVVTDRWEFECSWQWDDTDGMYGTIIATSTEEHDSGPGLTIEYDIEYEDFSGYGQGSEY